MEPTDKPNETERENRETDGDDDIQQKKTISTVVDWLVAALFVLGGLFFATVGAGLNALADRDRIADWVADENIEADAFTDEELVDITYAVLTWGGIGTILVGVLLIVAGVGFLLYRRRQRATREEPGLDTITLSLIGGIVTVVLSAIPLSPILGGLVSGYLRDGEPWDGTRIGAYAGLVAAIPVVLLGLLVLGVFAIVALELSLGSVALAGGFAILFGILIGVAYLVGLSGLGGYLGAKLAERDRD